MAKIDLRVTEPIAWLASKPKRVKIAVGGRGSAKSIGVADIMLKYVDDGERVCCTREFQNSIDDSVHQNLIDEIDRLGVEGFTHTNNHIYSSNGGEVFYKGLARNITSLKSLSGVKRLWIEEGESVSDKSLRVLTPSIRSTADANNEEEDPPEIWITMNRGSRLDAISKKYLKRAEEDLARHGRYEDDLMMIVEVNWRDNPWFPPELEQERQDDFENLDRAEYDHIWEGKYRDSVPGSIIKPEWFDAAVDAHIKLGIKPRGEIKVSHDPADSGDARAYAVKHGILIKDVRENEDDDVNDACDWALNRAIYERADMFIYDGDGLGVGLRRQVASSLKDKKISFKDFHGGDSVENPDAEYIPTDKDSSVSRGRKNKDIFKNLRTQKYWRLADRFFNTYLAVEKGQYIDPDELISIASDIKLLDKLRSEICSIPRKKTGAGLIQILSKEEMEKLFDTESPNMADCVMMLETDATIRKKRKKLDIDTSYVV